MSAEAKQREYKHSEAFALMWYACPCGHRERAWNSRDGVTPYQISCASCGGLASHADWHLDETDADYQAQGGQLVFRNGTLAEALDILDARRGDVGASRMSSSERYQESLRISQGETPEFLPGWPHYHRHGYGTAEPNT